MPVWMALTGALPALALMTLVDLADAKRPEPHWQVRKVAVLGGLSVLPVFLLPYFQLLPLFPGHYCMMPVLTETIYQ